MVHHRWTLNKAFWKENEGSADYFNEYYYEMPEAAALIWYNATEERMKREQCFGYCNNHTSMCFDLNQEQYCSSCLHNTQGQTCNHCRDGFYRNPNRDSIGFEDSCIPVWDYKELKIRLIPNFQCNCNKEGSNDFRCDELTGQCHCHEVISRVNEDSKQIVAEIVGLQCDQCKVS